MQLPAIFHAPALVHTFQPSMPPQPLPTDGPSPVAERVGVLLSELDRLDTKLQFEHPRNSVVSGEWPTDLSLAADRLHGASIAASFGAASDGKLAGELLEQASTAVRAFGAELATAREQHVSFSPANADWLTRLGGPRDAVQSALHVLRNPREL